MHHSGLSAIIAECVRAQVYKSLMYMQFPDRLIVCSPTTAEGDEDHLDEFNALILSRTGALHHLRSGM